MRTACRLALVLATLCGTTGCAGMISGAVQAGIRGGLRDHLAMHDRCRHVLGEDGDSGGSQLALAGPLSLGDPRNIIAQLESVITGGGRGPAGLESVAAPLTAALERIERHDALGAACRGESGGDAIGREMRDAVAALCTEVRRIRDDADRVARDVASLFTAIRTRASAVRTSCGASVGDVRTDARGELSVRGVAQCGVALVGAVSEALDPAMRPRIERAIALVTSLPARVERLGDRGVDLSAALATLARQTVSQAWSAGALARVARESDAVMGAARGAVSFLGQGAPLLRALVAGDIEALARAVLERGLFDQAADALLAAIEPELRRVDRLIDRADDATYGLVSVSSTLLNAQIDTAMRHAVAGIEDVLERAHVPVLSFVRASCRAMRSRREQLAGSRVVPRLYRAIVDAWFARHRETSVTPRSTRAASDATGANGDGPVSDALRTFHRNVELDLAARTITSARDAQGRIDETAARELASSMASDAARDAVTTGTLTGSPTGAIERRVIDVTSAASTATTASAPAAATTTAGGGGAAIATSGATASSAGVSDVRGMIDAQRAATEQLRTTLQTQTAALAAIADQGAGTAENRFCAAITGGASCHDASSGAFAIEVSEGFPSQQWSGSGVHDALASIARAARRSGVEVDAEVHGFASATSASCDVVLGARENPWRDASVNVSALPEGVHRIAGPRATVSAHVDDATQTLRCGDDGADSATGNDALSLLRATWSAGLLAAGSGGAIRVRALRYYGADFATGGNDRRDRSVRIVFWRRSAPRVAAGTAGRP